MSPWGEGPKINPQSLEGVIALTSGGSRFEHVNFLLKDKHFGERWEGEWIFNPRSVKRSRGATG